MTGGQLTSEERANTRKALLFLAERSPPAQLAEALGMSRAALSRARSRTRAPTVRLAALIALAAEVSLQDVLSGAWPGDLCPRCGRGLRAARDWRRATSGAGVAVERGEELVAMRAAQLADKPRRGLVVLGEVTPPDCAAYRMARA